LKLTTSLFGKENGSSKESIKSLNEQTKKISQHNLGPHTQIRQMQEALWATQERQYQQD
jgi:hypothetical protein